MSPTTTPKRLPIISELLGTIVFAMTKREDIKSEPKEQNSILAICEIITGLPPQWFTQDERIIVASVIQEFYGDPVKFVSEIMDGNLSYVNVCEDDCRGRSATELCDSVMKMHILQFGSL
jgi:hypothetical protein